MKRSSLLRLWSLSSTTLRSGLICGLLPALVAGLGHSTHAQVFIRLGDVTVSSGEIIGNTVYLDSATAEIRFPIIYGNRNTWSYNVSNAFIIYSDDDGIPGDGLAGSRGTGTANWGFPTTNGGNYKFGTPSGPVSGLWVDTTGYFPKSEFGAIFKFNCFGCNGRGADTVIFAGAANDIEQTALRPEDSGVLFDIRVLAKLTDTGKWICIDSASKYPPTNTWKWAPFNCAPSSPCENTLPSWSGAKCFVLQRSDDSPSGIANCIPTLFGQPNNPITYDFNVTGADQSGVRWSVTSGIGVVDSLTGVYSVDGPEAGVYPVTISATDSSGTWPTSSCQFNVSTSGLIISNCLPRRTASYCIPISYDFNLTRSDQSGVIWSVVSRVGAIDPVTGIFTASLVSPGTYSVTIIVSDSAQTEATASCAFDLIVSDCGVANCVPRLTGSYCSPILYDFNIKGENQSNARWSLITGVGMIDSLTGVYTASQLIPGNYIVTIAAIDTSDSESAYSCQFDVIATDCSIAYCIPRLIGSYCSTIFWDFNVTGTVQSSVRWSLVSGVGTIDSLTGIYTVNGLSAGTYPVTISVRDSSGTGETRSCSFDVVATNYGLRVSCPPFAPKITVGETQTQRVHATADCVTLTYFLAGGDLTGVTVNPQTGVVTYTGDSADIDVIPRCARVGVTDGTDTIYCQVCWDFNKECAYRLAINKGHWGIPGLSADVDITLESINAAEGLAGFDLLVAYENPALVLQSATSGALYNECGWEYFTYRHNDSGDCGGAGCPSGLVRLVGIADLPIGQIPPCGTPKYVGSLPTTLASMRFLISIDRGLECMFLPIRFYWNNCWNNSLSNAHGSKLFINCHVFDYDNYDPIDDPYAVLPNYLGTPNSCLDSIPSHSVERGVELHNGGIDIVCADSVDNRGDINLNGISYEIADAVVFANYFIYGLPAFSGHVEGSRAASDVNSDGIPLTMADLIYLIRVVLGDAPPFPKVETGSTATVSTDNGNISITGVDNIGGLLLILKGEIAVTSSRTDLVYFTAFDGVNTRVIALIPFASPGPITGFSGGLFSAPEAEIISIDIVDISGASVKSEFSVPKDFALNQNYPNPFNPTTTISFDMPKSGAYKITVYNTAGQKVTELSGTATAGTNEVSLNLEASASGVYIYRLEAEGYTATRKAVLLK